LNADGGGDASRELLLVFTWCKYAKNIAYYLAAQADGIYRYANLWVSVSCDLGVVLGPVALGGDEMGRNETYADSRHIRVCFYGTSC
jgi:hypothetical protein